ncbi:MAG: methionine--tRNA ligase, partial [Myxococcota bacterium]|nr:methionine--tRNA ligase [Myxococcota bacterium]
MSRRILVTSALPYANGPIHIGHLVEYVQTDVWVRFQRMRGHDCRYFCADDTHGTAITIRARAEGRSEEALIASMSEAHQRDFAGFDVAFDHYGSTHSETNRRLCASIWEALRARGLVVRRSVERLFDPEAGLFLADRFVRGRCPRCDAPEQYGDGCERCQAAYAPVDLREPRSALTGATPVLRESEQHFVRIEELHDFLDAWTASEEHLQPETANYVRGSFLAEPLRDWDVSRPAPYFGFEIPDAPGHFWYVWFDAPVGYAASCREWCEARGEDFARWWGPAGPANAGTEIHHFIGRDIVYFHTLFWPAVLRAADWRLPHKVHVHGFLKVNGEKMSKSRGTFVEARTYLEHLDPACLRYFYASRLSGRDEDIDLDLDAFVAQVNAELVGKVVNLASRTARFAEPLGLARAYPDDGGLFARAAEEGEAIAAAYEATAFGEAVRRILALADAANAYVEAARPWDLRKQEGRQEELRAVCTVALNLFRQIVVYLAPVLPELARKTGELLGDPITRWEQAGAPLTGTPVGRFRHLIARVDPRAVRAMLDEAKDAAAHAAEASAGQAGADPAPSAARGRARPPARPRCLPRWHPSSPGAARSGAGRHGGCRGKASPANRPFRRRPCEPTSTRRRGRSCCARARVLPPSPSTPSRTTRSAARGGCV